MEEIFVPAAGMAMEDALLAEWLKRPGDAVAAGEAVAVVETDKASVELSASTTGVLGQHRCPAGVRVAAGETVAVVLAPGEKEAVPPSSDAARPAPAAEEAVAATEVTATPAVSDGRPPHRQSPRQRRQAVLAEASGPPPFVGFAREPAREPPPPPTVPAVSAGDSFRQAISAQVVQSWTTIPHFSVARTIDATELHAALSMARRFDSSITVTDFLLLALARALLRGGQSADLGLAVATERGVQIAVVRDPSQVTFEELVRRRKSAVQRAREFRLSGDDAIRTSVTLSNLGAMGVTWFTGVVPVGQSALLTTGTIADQPAVVGRGITIRPEFYATVTADHRVLDGADSARLLQRFAAAIATMGEDR